MNDIVLDGRLSPSHLQDTMSQSCLAWDYASPTGGGGLEHDPEIVALSETNPLTMIKWTQESAASGGPFSFEGLRELLAPSLTLSLNGFEKYTKDNWDGEDAERISVETLSAARAFLARLPANVPSPSPAPGEDGTIGLEWIFTEGDIRKIFIDIGPDDLLSIYSRRADGRILSMRRSSDEFFDGDLLHSIFFA